MAQKKVVTAQRLTELALLRLLPSFIEETWVMRTGINPVSTMLGIREKKKASAYVAVGVLAAIILVIGLFGYTDANVFFLAQTLLLVAIISISLWHRYQQSPFDFWALEPIEHHVKEFCDDLSAFCGWTGRVPQESEEVLKQAARAIMIGTALSVLNHEMTNADISNRYDTLRRLGLVPVGGYKEYFDEAQKLFDREKSTSTG